MIKRDEVGVKRYNYEPNCFIQKYNYLLPVEIDIIIYTIETF